MKISSQKNGFSGEVSPKTGFYGGPSLKNGSLKDGYRRSMVSLEWQVPLEVGSLVRRQFRKTFLAIVRQ